MHHLRWATGACLNSRGCPTLGSFSHGSQKPGQVSRHGEPPHSRWEFRQKRRGRERERERETRGEPDFQETSSRDQSEKAFYTFDYTQKSVDNTKLCSVNHPDSYQDQALSLHTQLYTKVLGDLHHLLARRPINILWPFPDKGLSTRRLICLKSFVLPKVWCHSQKALNKVTFLCSKDATIYNNERSTVIYNKEKVN